VTKRLREAAAHRPNDYGILRRVYRRVFGGRMRLRTPRLGSLLGNARDAVKLDIITIFPAVRNDSG
jgi:hypothetical protein